LAKNPAEAVSQDFDPIALAIMWSR
jgi:hypothetical protein